jgi:hypothetical protein
MVNLGPFLETNGFRNPGQEPALKTPENVSSSILHLSR